MITKLDNPGKKQFEYKNTGSVARLKNYLVAYDEKLRPGEFFFNDEHNNLSPEQFYRLVDKNVKGLTKEDQKFYSFSINPSEKELQHIGNDYHKFKEYVKGAVNENYAAAFAGKKNVRSDDIMWGAIVHEKRYYTKEEYSKQKSFLKKEPGFKPGEEKPFSMHAHVVVSARNKGQTKSLTVLTKQHRLSRDFNLKGFQKRNEELFQRKFFYESGRNIYEENQLKILNRKLENLEKFNPLINKDKIRDIARKMNYEAKFDRHLGQLLSVSKQRKQVADLDSFFEKGLYKTQIEIPNNIQQQPSYLNEKKTYPESGIGEEIDKMLSYLNNPVARDIPAPIDKLKEKKKKKKNRLGFHID